MQVEVKVILVLSRVCVWNRLLIWIQIRIWIKAKHNQLDTLEAIKRTISGLNVNETTVKYWPDYRPQLTHNCVCVQCVCVWALLLLLLVFYAILWPLASACQANVKLFGRHQGVNASSYLHAVTFVVIRILRMLRTWGCGGCGLSWRYFRLVIHIYVAYFCGLLVFLAAGTKHSYF